MSFWTRPSASDLRQRLAEYEDQADAHRQDALLGRRAGSEAVYAHQMEIAAWYEGESDKLERKIAKREHTR